MCELLEKSVCSNSSILGYDLDNDPDWKYYDLDLHIEVD